MVKRNLLRNRYFLYILLFLAVTNLLGYLALRDFEAVTLFVVLGVVISYFSKNMVIILGLAMIGTALFRGMGGRNLREGLVVKGVRGKAKRAREKEALENPVDDEEDEEDEGEAGENSEAASPPAKAATESEEDLSLGKRVDYAGTMEAAYNNLGRILGSDGVNNLTKETQTLMKQQTELMKQLEGLAPIMENAKEVMKTLESSGMGSMMSKFIPQAQALMQKK